MADMYIRRGRAPSHGTTRSLWVVFALVLLVVVVGVIRLSQRAKTRAAERESAEIHSEAVPGETPSARTEEARAHPSTPERPAPEAPASPGRERAVRTLLEQAQAALQDNDLARSRAAAMDALDQAPNAPLRRAAQDLLGDLHIQLVFNPYPMEEKNDYIIERGDSLDVLARRFGTTVDLLRRGNHIQGSLIRVGNRLRILQGPFRIEVSKTTNELTVYLQDRFFKRYPVGTGRFDQTPTGQARVTDRIAHPTWYKPDGRVIPYGHPENELGTHWLSLDIPGYGIHGTWEPETIGHRASAGCVRLLNEDVEELFTLIPVGTEVLITE